MLVATIVSLATLVAFNVDHTVDLRLDASSSSLSWTGYAETGGFAPTGSVDPIGGTAKFDHGKLVGGEFTVDMTTITYSDKQLEKHLKNEDFFHVTEFPEAKFKVTKMNGNRITGDLTIRGKTNAVEFDVVVKQETAAYSVKGKITVDRTQFDIKYNSSDFFQDLGSYAIKNDFDLTFDLVFK